MKNVNVVTNKSNLIWKKKNIKILILIPFLLTIFSCSKMNSNAPVTSLGKHPAKWFDEEHRVSVTDQASSFALSTCSECHGKDFKGGISKLSCYLCHSVSGAHPVSWVKGHKFAALNEINSCTVCHGKNFGKGENDSKSCYACHDGPEGKEHPEDWTSKHAAHAKEFDAACYDCHGADYNGGIVEIGCYKCHLGGEEGHPHPKDWGFDSTEILLNHQDAVFNDSTCNFSYCHGTDSDGGESTISWGVAPSCNVADFSGRICH